MQAYTAPSTSEERSELYSAPAQTFSKRLRCRAFIQDDTFSGWVKVPALQGVLGSHRRTDRSQLPVTMTLTSGQYSTQRMGASWVPTIVSVRGTVWEQWPLDLSSPMHFKSSTFTRAVTVEYMNGSFGLKYDPCRLFYVSRPGVSAWINRNHRTIC